jgi:hypothetical protein
MPQERGSSRRKLSQNDPSPGCAERGQEINPADVPNEAESDETGKRPVPAPAPGVPISSQRYQRMKEKARRRRNQQDVPAQEDRPRRDDNHQP